MLTDRVAVGVFDDNLQAQNAIAELKQAGFRDDQIGLAVRDSHETTDLAQSMEGDSHAGEGAVAGMVAGAGIGGAWALGIAAGVLPAIGPVIAGGILASLLASAATGAAAGGLVGALIGLGVPEEEAHHYEEHFHAGRIIVTVQAGERFQEAASILSRFGAFDEERVRSVHHV
jgi:hypothetical protein